MGELAGDECSMRKRAASYLGRAPAIAFAASTPSLFQLMSRLVSGVLTKPLRNEQRKENGGVSGRYMQHSKARGELHLTWEVPPR